MRRAGFSLIELLVVIGVIALLIAIIAPALQRSKQQAKAVLCSSNIKQLLTGLFIYDAENQGLPFALDTRPLSPPPGGWSGFSEYDRKGWRWFNYMEEFYSKANKTMTVLRCPSRHLERRKFGDNILCGNYGINQSICKSATGRRSRAEFIGTPLSITGMPHPGRTLLIVDSGYSMINWWHATDNPPIALGNTAIEDTAYIPGLKINEKRDLWPGQKRDAINGRHPNKTVNVGFADGRVNRIKVDKLLVEKIGDTYKNRSPLWLPR